MQQIKLRHTPVLEFVMDHNFKKTLRTLELIDQAMAEIQQSDRDHEGQAPPADQRNGETDQVGTSADEERDEV